MKILTKILNILVIIFVCIGIYATWGYFFKYKPLEEDYNRAKQENKELSIRQDSKNRKIIDLQTDIYVKDVKIKERENTINSLRDDSDKIEDSYNNEIEELKNITLEEAVEIILDYYNVDGSNATIINYQDSIQIAFKPLLVHRWTYTLAKLESRNMEVSALQNQVLEYDSLIYDYQDKVQLLEKQDSLTNENYNLEKEKNGKLQEIIENRNQKIKSLKIQRNAAGIIVGVVIVLAIL